MSGPLASVERPGVKAEGHLLHAMRQEVAELLDRKHLGFPGAQPVSFARRHLEELTRQDYFVCEKSDGIRYLLYLTQDENNEEIHYLIDRKNDYWFLPKGALHFPVPRDIEGFHVKTLIDGELVIDRLKNGQMQPKYLVFDCMVLDGNSLMNRTLDKRIAYFKERIFDPYSALLKDYPDEIQFMHFLVELKSMQVSYGIEMMFRQILPNLPHGNDGLIFTCRMTDYKHGTDQNILKWKPEAENSIDFRMRMDFPLIQPDQHDIAEGITKPYPDYDALPTINLFVGANGNEDLWYATMYLEPQEWESLKGLGEPLEDRIVECSMDSAKRWRYMRFRDDKENPNYITTVESVIESITDRVTEKDLLAAAKGIRDAWKLREAKAKANSGAMNAGTKRKAEDQGNGRPSPGPPVRP
ncbi:mRNA-capping enzyme subunit alpha [Coleophoma crateriformis]|uniref:mRNA-capping enzyme subunit alpha n=1 Tax=Coleophoma crateriformis TaxID=565419 RepID=A0A3D8QTW5_9HELO|nr:mRNA-capping enzyme subunit alpha [Coleophoma crateriformis]